jgi:glycosyltransferase involved in cell wall biosynthesis
VELSIVIPTRNEAPNIDELLGRLSRALEQGPSWEVLFVDDSDDATPTVIGAQRARGRPVHLHHRPRGHRPNGLAGAVQDGFAAARGRIIVVMDADLQHPPETLPRLIAPVLAGAADLVVGTRYAVTGERDGLSGPWRRAISSGSRRLVHLALPRSRSFSDPLSGLFAFDRSIVAGVGLHANGFKILLEVVAKGHWQRGDNVAYRFEPRWAGRSKASLREGLQFARHLARLTSHRREVPDAEVADR